MAAAIDFKFVRRRGGALLRKQGQSLSGSGGDPKADAANPRSPYRGDPERAHLDNSSNLEKQSRSSDETRRISVKIALFARLLIAPHYLRSLNGLGNTP